MEPQRAELDQEILLICEDIEQCLKRAEQLPDYNDSSSYYCRLTTLQEKIATERRLQEEISLPCRLLLEHFSLFLGKWDYSIGLPLRAGAAGTRYAVGHPCWSVGKCQSDH